MMNVNRWLTVAVLLAAVAFNGGCLTTGVHRPTVDPAVFELARQADPAHPVRPSAAAPARLAIARIGYPDGHSYNRPKDDAPPALIALYDTPDAVAAGEVRDLASQLTGVRDTLVIQPDMTAASGGRVGSPDDLRRVALRYGCDLVLAYSLSIDRDSTHHFPIFSVLTLGFVPNVTSEVDGRAQGMVIDTRTGYIYARIDVSSDTWQLANAWSSGEAEDQSQQRVERRLLAQLIAQTRHQWPTVASQLATTPSGPTYPTTTD